eukprot:Em0006g1525a
MARLLRAPPRTTYINIADDEYAEQDFGVEDTADNDEYADKDFENLVKQFRVDEKMCYYPFPRSSTTVKSIDLEHCVLYVATPKQLFDFMAVNPAISLPSLHPMN